MKDAGIQPEEVGYVNAHATSTPAGDGNESRAIETVFGEHALSHKLKISGTKSMTGHLLGGAGGLEAGITVLALVEPELPPTINLENVDPECRLDYVPNKAIAAQLRRGAVEFVWIRRHQRHAHHAALDGVAAPGSGKQDSANPGRFALFAFRSKYKPQEKTAAVPTPNNTIKAHHPKTAI